MYCETLNGRASSCPPAPHTTHRGVSGHSSNWQEVGCPCVCRGCSCHLHCAGELVYYLPPSNRISCFAHLFPAVSLCAAVMASLLFHLLFSTGSQQSSMSADSTAFPCGVYNICIRVLIFEELTYSSFLTCPDDMDTG